MRINLRFSRRRLICLTGALFACFTLYIWYSSQEESNRIWILKREQYIEEYLENKQFVDKKIASIKNQACHVPSLNAFSPDILRFMGMRNITCDNVQYGSVTIDGLFEIKNPSKVITDVKVYYIRRAYHENEKDFRNKDYAVKLSEVIELTPNQKGEYGLQLIEDFVRVEMYVDNSYHVEFHAHVSKQTESEARKDTIRRNDVKGMGLDFVFVMIDSQSHANFDRQLMRTMRTLKADTNTVIFNGHTIVGDGTTAQIAAMFIGELEENLAETRRGYENAGSCDQYNFIFKDLHKAGYVTLYSEDDPFFSTFHYRLHGFDNPPTTWYTRPYWIGEIENSHSTMLLSQLNSKRLALQTGSQVAKAMKAVNKSTFRPKSMLSMESQLPRLPVPALKSTMEKYIRSLEPLLFDNEYKKTKEIVREFQKAGGIGEQLQIALLKKSQETDNWLAEWWDNCAYFEFRSPVTINSSPGIQFPQQSFKTETDQYRYTAKMIRTILLFKELVDSESLPVDYAGGDPLTMNQYKRLLSICRVPHPKRDAVVTASLEKSRHMIVTHNNHFYKLNVYKDDSQLPLSEEELMKQLQHIVDSSHQRDEFPVSILTSLDRNSWAQGWKRLTRDTVNLNSVNQIVESICFICLDQPVAPTTTNLKYEIGSSLGQMLHGGGSNENSMNRWFDKICQVCRSYNIFDLMDISIHALYAQLPQSLKYKFVVNRNGCVGVCYEHSTAEGPPLMTMCNKIMQIDLKEKITDNQNSIHLAPPERLTWNLNADLIDRVELAKEHIDQMVNDLDAHVFQFDEFGKDVIKKFRISPDAFFQVSLQLAYFRLHSHHPPTYESGSIRKFAHGRTETIRSATPAAARFAREMDRNNYNNSDKRELFLKAVQAHTQYSKEAAQFQSIDRHLLGLKLTALSSGVPLPELFRDKAYGYAMHFRLSTSQVPSKHKAILGFGPVVPDGYGVCYNPLEKQILYAVTSYNSHPKTHAGDFGTVISQTLADNRVLLETQSKL